MAREEARYVVEQIQGYPISMPVAYDIEDEPQMNLPDNASRTDLVLAFCEEIREAGYYPWCTPTNTGWDPSGHGQDP